MSERTELIAQVSKALATRRAASGAPDEQHVPRTHDHTPSPAGPRPACRTAGTGPLWAYLKLGPEPEEDRGTFGTTMLLGILPGALVLAVLVVAALATNGLDAPVRIAAWAIVGLLGVWWLLALVMATARRLRDADADPWLALAWPMLPVAAAAGGSWAFLLNALGLVRLPDTGTIAFAIAGAAVAAGALLVVAVAACLTPTNAWRWRHARIMLWFTVVLLPLPALLGWLAWKLLHRILRPNLGTRLGLLAAFIALCIVTASGLEGAPRIAALTGVGVVFTVLHLLRWMLQEQHFGTMPVTIRYSDVSYDVGDPRWRPWAARPFKLLGVVWIWTAVVAAAGEANALVWVIVWAGFLVYVLYPALPAAAIGVLILGSLGTRPEDVALLGFAMTLLAAWGLTAGAFGLTWIFSAPTDRRYAFTRSYWAHRMDAEW